MKRLQTLREVFKRLALPSEKLLIAGSFPLGLVGIVDEETINDVDIIVLDKALWNQLKGLPDIKKIKDDRGYSQQLIYHDPVSGETLDFTKKWPMGEHTVQEILDNHMVIDGVCVMSLEDVIRTKILMDRPKDRQHLSLLREWLHTGQGSYDVLTPALKRRIYRDIAMGLSKALPKPDIK